MNARPHFSTLETSRVGGSFGLGGLLPRSSSVGGVEPAPTRRILYVTSEMTDFIKSGGLGDVSAALPRSLRRQYDVRVLIPGYRQVTSAHPEMRIVARLDAAHGLPACELGEVVSPDGLTIYVVLCPDLFDREGIKGPPETWDQTIEIAKALHRPEQDQYGFVTTARRGLYAGLELYQIMATHGGIWLDAEFQPHFNNEIGAKSLAILIELMKYAHPVTLNAADDEANAALANGSAVFAPMEWGTSALTNPQFTKFADVFEAAVVPKGSTPESRQAPLAGGFGQYINIHGSDKRAAFEFIVFRKGGEPAGR